MAIEYRLEDDVAIVALRDEKVNAMSVPFFQDLMAALDRAEKDDARTVVVAGKPGMFSAGLNVKLLPSLDGDGLRELMDHFARSMLRVWTFPIPTVAACTGHAIAGGAILTYACDLRYAADGPYRIQLNETAIGLPLPAWAMAISGAAIPRRWWNEALLHAHAYTPVEAVEKQLFDGLVAEGADPVAHAAAASAHLRALDLRAYARSKRRLRGAEAERVLALQQGELAGA